MTKTKVLISCAVLHSRSASLFLHLQTVGFLMQRLILHVIRVSIYNYIIHLLNSFEIMVRINHSHTEKNLSFFQVK